MAIMIVSSHSPKRCVIFHTGSPKPVWDSCGVYGKAYCGERPRDHSLPDRTRMIRNMTWRQLAPYIAFLALAMSGVRPVRAHVTQTVHRVRTDIGVSFNAPTGF